jgi:acyl-CoA hydrolase
MDVSARLAPKAVAESVTEMTEYVLPVHANVLGNVFGGQILAWVDVCAAICAQRHTGRGALTAGIDELSFEHPVRIGQVVHLKGRITAAFRTSVEILVEVEGEEATTRRRWPCVTAFVTYVAVDDSLRPTPVPPLLVQTPEERALAEAAQTRRDRRLAQRKKNQMGRGSAS